MRGSHSAMCDMVPVNTVAASCVATVPGSLRIAYEVIYVSLSLSLSLVLVCAPMGIRMTELRRSYPGPLRQTADQGTTFLEQARCT